MVPSLGMSSEHAYSSVSKVAASESLCAFYRVTCGGGGGFPFHSFTDLDRLVSIFICHWKAGTSVWFNMFVKVMGGSQHFCHFPAVSFFRVSFHRCISSDWSGGDLVIFLMIWKKKKTKKKTTGSHTNQQQQQQSNYLCYISAASNMDVVAAENLIPELLHCTASLSTVSSLPRWLSSQACPQDAPGASPVGVAPAGHLGHHAGPAGGADDGGRPAGGHSG